MQLSLCDYDVLNTKYNDNPHEVANVFKLILRDMAEPVCTFESVNFFLKPTLDEEMNDCEDAIRDYKRIFDPRDKRLPELNKNTI